MIRGKYKPGQIITLRSGNKRYVCKVIKCYNGCSICDFRYSCIDMLCFIHIGSCAYRLIRKYECIKQEGAKETE